MSFCIFTIVSIFLVSLLQLHVRCGSCVSAWTIHIFFSLYLSRSSPSTSFFSVAFCKNCAHFSSSIIRVGILHIQFRFHALDVVQQASKSLFSFSLFGRSEVGRNLKISLVILSKIAWILYLGAGTICLSNVVEGTYRYVHKRNKQCIIQCSTSSMLSCFFATEFNRKFIHFAFTVV